MKKKVKSIHSHSRIDGVVPGVRGQRAFPNKEIRSFDPFVMLDHIGCQEVGETYFVDGANSAHPHRGFETITFMFEGKMDHKDSMGNSLALQTGDIQRMNAGSGIIHGGNFSSDAPFTAFHEVQLWVNVPAKSKMSRPEVQNVKTSEIPEIHSESGRIRIVSGELLGETGPISTIQPTQIAHSISNERQHIRLGEFKEGYNTLLYVLKGGIHIEGNEVNEHHSAVFELTGEYIEYDAQENTEVLIIAGKPINEPVVMGGPFVMNTPGQIEQAYVDYEAGKFGKI